VERDTFIGSHDGYGRLVQPITHTRSIFLDKGHRVWQIIDLLQGEGEHLVEVFFHPAVAVEPVADGGAVRLRAPRGDLWLFPPPGTEPRQEPGWISAGYGLRRPATVLVYAVRAPMPLCLRTQLVLVNRGTPLDVARSLVESVT
jgi:uncharacterized heparinase superfamily protein